MKITTRMKRNASGERWGKSSKGRVRNTNQILSFLDFNKAETPLHKRKSKPKKIKAIYKIWDTIRVQAMWLYSPHMPKEPSVFFSRREKNLTEVFREYASVRWLNYLIDIVIDKVVTEWKVTTYYGKYLDMDVAIEDRFYKIIKL